MRKHEFILVLVLLCAIAAQAVNTTVTPSGSSQHTLIGDVGPMNEDAVKASEQALDAESSSDGTLLPMLDEHEELSFLPLVDLGAPLASGGQEAAGQPAMGWIEGVGDAKEWAGDLHWSVDPQKYADSGFVNAKSRVELPAFAEIDWVATPLPTAKQTSIMEIFVFPLLGMLVVILVVAMLVVRLRRRRTVSPAQQLLHV